MIDSKTGKNIFGKSYSDWLRKKQYHFNLFSLKEWNSVFEKAGFEICSISPTLPPRLVHAMEIAHYFSIPSLISYVFLKKWVFWSSWYQFFGVDSFVENKLEVELKDFISFKDEEIKNIDLQNALHDIQDLKNKDIGNSGSLFYVLRKR